MKKKNDHFQSIASVRIASLIKFHSTMLPSTMHSYKSLMQTVVLYSLTSKVEWNSVQRVIGLFMFILVEQTVADFSESNVWDSLLKSAQEK